MFCYPGTESCSIFTQHNIPKQAAKPGRQLVGQSHGLRGLSLSPADVIKVRLQLARNQLAAGAKPPGMVSDGCRTCEGGRAVGTWALPYVRRRSDTVSTRLGDVGSGSWQACRSAAYLARFVFGSLQHVALTCVLCRRCYLSSARMPPVRGNRQFGTHCPCRGPHVQNPDPPSTVTPHHVAWPPSSPRWPRASTWCATRASLRCGAAWGHPLREASSSEVRPNASFPRHTLNRTWHVGLD